MAIEGAPIGQGDQAILVQDVITKGFQIVQASRKLEALGARVSDVVALIDREESEQDPDFLKKNIKPTALEKLSRIKAYKEGAEIGYEKVAMSAP